MLISSSLLHTFFIFYYQLLLRIFIELFFYDIKSVTRLGRVDNFSCFDCFSPFRVLLIEFHCTFSISYKIVKNYVCYYFILIMMV